MWSALQAENIEAEREWGVKLLGRNRYLDFALFCNGEMNLDIECDGSRYHSSETALARDAERDNTLVGDGWSVLRYRSYRIHNEMPGVIREIRTAIERHGGLAEPEDWRSPRYPEGGLPGMVVSDEA